MVRGSYKGKGQKGESKRDGEKIRMKGDIVINMFGVRELRGSHCWLV